MSLSTQEETLNQENSQEFRVRELGKSRSSKKHIWLCGHQPLKSVEGGMLGVTKFSTV